MSKRCALCNLLRASDYFTVPKVHCVIDFLKEEGPQRYGGAEWVGGERLCKNHFENGRNCKRFTAKDDQGWLRLYKEGPNKLKISKKNKNNEKKNVANGDTLFIEAAAKRIRPNTERIEIENSLS
jgi:hypothetical protein